MSSVVVLGVRDKCVHEGTLWHWDWERFGKGIKYNSQYQEDAEWGQRWAEVEGCEMDGEFLTCGVGVSEWSSCLLFCPEFLLTISLCLCLLMTSVSSVFKLYLYFCLSFALVTFWFVFPVCSVMRYKVLDKESVFYFGSPYLFFPTSSKLTYTYSTKQLYLWL